MQAIEVCTINNNLVYGLSKFRKKNTEVIRDITTKTVCWQKGTLYQLATQAMSPPEEPV